MYISMYIYDVYVYVYLVQGGSVGGVSGGRDKTGSGVGITIRGAGVEGESDEDVCVDGGSVSETVMSVVD